mmetsp:Transcript_1661/g.2318  ORF Transcript_1661/g.2318 Transcript_1661/m.2318 type:complete len:233 (+) Transcript_1661:276-974(+)
MKRYNARNGLISDKVKTVVPLKLRKFFDSKGKLKSDMSDIPATQNSIKSIPTTATSTNRRGNKTASVDTTAVGKTQTKLLPVSEIKLGISSGVTIAKVMRKENPESSRAEQFVPPLIASSRDDFLPETTQSIPDSDENKANNTLQNSVDEKIAIEDSELLNKDGLLQDLEIEMSEDVDPKDLIILEVAEGCDSAEEVKEEVLHSTHVIVEEKVAQMIEEIELIVKSGDEAAF